MQLNNNEVINPGIPDNTLNAQISNNWNNNNNFNVNSNNDTNNPKIETWKKVLIGIGIFYAFICIIGVFSDFSDEENSEFFGTYIKTRNGWNHTVDSYIEITEDKLTYSAFGVNLVDDSYTIDKKNKQIKAGDLVFCYEIDGDKVSCIYRIGIDGVALDCHYRADYY